MPTLVQPFRAFGCCAIQDQSYIIISSYASPIAALLLVVCLQIICCVLPAQSAVIVSHAELRMLSPPSDVNATKLPALAPQATSFAGTAFRTGSDQLFDALVYC
jgi:hypothetical protein